MKILITTLLMFAALQIQAQSLTLQVQDRTFEEGDTVKWECEVYGFSQIGVFQFALKCDTATLNFSHIEVTGELPSLDDDHFSWWGKPGDNLTPGEIRSVWTNYTWPSVEDGKTIFAIKFIAKKSGTLSAAVDVWEEHPWVKPRAYKKVLIPIALEIAYYLPAVTATNKVANSPVHVWPNPFHDSFSVALDGDTERLRLYNAQGRMMWEVATECSTNARFEVDSNFVPGFYVLEAVSGNQRKTVKIVKK